MAKIIVLRKLSPELEKRIVEIKETLKRKTDSGAVKEFLIRGRLL